MDTALLFDATPRERALLAAAGARFCGIEEAEAAVVLSFADLQPGAWERAGRLRWILSLPAGEDHVPRDRLPAQARVVSTHGPNADAIAEHAFALLLAAAKRLPTRAAQLQRGAFDQTLLSRRLKGGTLLVVGAGPIGSRILRLGRAFGMRALLVRRSGAAHPDADEVVGLDALGRADAVVLAVPLTRETRGMVGPAQLAGMKDDAILVNVARGKLVDRAALLARLRATPSFTYATDVWWSYPRGEEKFQEDAVLLDNVICTPHVAAMVPGYREEMVAMAARNLSAIATGSFH